MIPVSFNSTVISQFNSSFSFMKASVKLLNHQILEDCLDIWVTGEKNKLFFSQIWTEISLHDSFSCSNLNISNVWVSITALFLTKDAPFESEYEVEISVVPKPARENWLLFSTYHSLKYPENGYVLRDSVFADKYPYDWKGDHLLTNYVSLYWYLNSKGYTVEILNEPLNCFNASEFKALLLIDAERELSMDEILKLWHDLVLKGLNLILFSEWNDVNLMLMHSMN